MADDFDSHAPGLNSPVEHLALVTASDVADLAFATRCLIVGTGGVIYVDTVGGETNVPFTATAGWNPVRVTRVYATGLTATTITAAW